MIDTEFARTPFGLRHKMLIHHVTAGTRIRRQERSWQKQTTSGLVLSDIRESVPLELVKPLVPADGWLSRADWINSSGTPVEQFDTTWQVPPEPTGQDAQTIFLFNSLMPPAQDYILQPVLQWGPSAWPASNAGWNVASWWVGPTNSPSFMSDLIPVNVGDQLTGRLSLASASNGSFDYISEFVGLAGTRLVVTNVAELTVCSEALEVYSIKSSADFPATPKTSMSGISIQAGGAQPAVQWIAGGTDPPTVVRDGASGAQIDIAYPTF
jgi:hypothetical protein